MLHILIKFGFFQKIFSHVWTFILYVQKTNLTSGINLYLSTKEPLSAAMDTIGHFKKKPTVLLVPGAWLRSSTYHAFLNLLQAAGYPTLYASYPSLDPADPFTADCAADSLSVRAKVLLPLIEAQGKDVVLVMHSYGGIPGSVAAHGLDKVQRMKEGRQGGVLGLIFVSGFVVEEGASVADGQGGSLPPWVKENNVIFPSSFRLSRFCSAKTRKFCGNSPLPVSHYQLIQCPFSPPMSSPRWPKPTLPNSDHTQHSRSNRPHRHPRGPMRLHSKDVWPTSCAPKTRLFQNLVRRQ